MIAQLQNMLSAPGSLAPRLRAGQIGALGALIAIAAAAWMWSSSPDYTSLYPHLDDRDGGAVLAALNQMNVPYRVSDSGGIMVARDRVHDLRLRLASQGLPKGTTDGFELMQNQKLGVTQFQEQVTYQRALEGELARSVQSLAAVRAARVHLAIPKPTMFVRDAQKPTASVLVKLHAGRRLERAQVAAVVHLVASSVPQLSARDISVIDDEGNLLTDAGGGQNGLDPAQFAYVQQVEGAYNDRIVQILEPLVGRGNVRARVTADLDFSSTESTAESFKPNQETSAVRSQVVSEGGGASGSAAGVPGSASNRPGAAPAPAQGPGPGARRDSTVNYEVDRQVQHVRSPVGAIRRLSAAVVVNYRRSTDAEGKVSASPLKPEELEQVNALVRQAMGFSEPRGDSMNVTHAPFSTEEAAALPDVPVWQQPEYVQLAKDIGRGGLVAALALYLLLGLIRPLVRQIAAPPPAPQPLEAATDKPALSASVAGALPASANSLEAARQTARQDPRIAANVIRNWVAKE